MCGARSTKCTTTAELESLHSETSFYIISTATIRTTSQVSMVDRSVYGKLWNHTERPWGRARHYKYMNSIKLLNLYRSKLQARAFHQAIPAILLRNSIEARQDATSVIDIRSHSPSESFRRCTDLSWCRNRCNCRI